MMHDFIFPHSDPAEIATFNQARKELFWENFSAALHALQRVLRPKLLRNVIQAYTVKVPTTHVCACCAGGAGGLALVKVMKPQAHDAAHFRTCNLRQPIC
jgi:hypothetical protein